MTTVDRILDAVFLGGEVEGRAATTWVSSVEGSNLDEIDRTMRELGLGFFTVKRGSRALERFERMEACDFILLVENKGDRPRRVMHARLRPPSVLNETIVSRDGAPNWMSKPEEFHHASVAWTNAACQVFTLDDQQSVEELLSSLRRAGAGNVTVHAQSGALHIRNGSQSVLVR
jgi:hypothetical protein